MALRRRQGLRHCVDLYVLLRGQATHPKGNSTLFLAASSGWSRWLRPRRSPLYFQKQTYAVQKLMSAKGQKRTAEQTRVFYAARSTRISISLRSAPKSIGLVKSVSAPCSRALRLVSASP